MEKQRSQCWSPVSNTNGLDLIIIMTLQSTVYKTVEGPSVRLSVSSFDRSSGGFAAERRAAGDIAINSGGRRAPQQHGAQQQMRAVSR